MGLRTFSEMKDRLKFMHGQNTSFEAPTDYYGQWINEAYQLLTNGNRIWSLQRNYRFPELETSSIKPTAANTAYIDVPTDCLIASEIWDSTNDVLLRGISWYQYVRTTGRASSYSKPTQWTRRGGYIYLLPTPDAVYSLTIYYRKRVAELSAVGDVTLIGAEWDSIIIKMAYVQSLEKLGEYEKAVYEKKELTDMLINQAAIYDQESKSRREYMHIDPAYSNYEY